MAVYGQLQVDKANIKLRWQEAYVSSALNRKLLSTVPRGVYRGFELKQTAPTSRFVDLDLDPVNNDSIAVVEDWGDGYSSTVYFSAKQTLDVSLAFSDIGNTIPFGGLTLYVVLDVDYRVGATTTGFLKVVDAAGLALLPYSIKIGRLDLPGGATAVLNTYINQVLPAEAPDDNITTKPFGTPAKLGYLYPDAAERLPTHDEKDAMDNANAPSASNPFATEVDTTLKVIAEPDRVDANGLVAATKIALPVGTYFVGTGISGTAKDWFRLFEDGTEFELTGTDDVGIPVQEVYKDAALSVILVPSVDGDANGFYISNGSNLWLKLDFTGTVTTSITGNVDVYTAIKKVMSTLSVNALLKKPIQSQDVDVEVQKSIARIYGAAWNDKPRHFRWQGDQAGNIGELTGDGTLTRYHAISNDARFEVDSTFKFLWRHDATNIAQMTSGYFGPPAAASTMDIGLSGTPWRNLFMHGAATIGDADADAHAIKGSWLHTNQAGTITRFKVDGTIGASAGVDPESGYAFKVGGADMKLEHTAPTFVRREQDVVVDSGGLWREQLTGGDWAFEENTAVGGDFSTKRQWWLTDRTNSRWKAQAHVVPLTDDLYDLGSTTGPFEWRNLYIDGTAFVDTLSLDTTDGLGVSSTVKPTTDGALDLGSSSRRWFNMFLDKLDLSTVASEGLVSDFLPDTNNSRALGSLTRKFSNIYAVNFTTDNFTFTADFLPLADVNGQDLGSGTLRWTSAWAQTGMFGNGTFGASLSSGITLYLIQDYTALATYYVPFQDYVTVTAAVSASAVGAAEFSISIPAGSFASATNIRGVTSYASQTRGSVSGTTAAFYGSTTVSGTSTSTSVRGADLDVSVSGASALVTNVMGGRFNLSGTLTTPATSAWAVWANNATNAVTGYGIFASSSGVGTTGYGVFASVTGATTNRYGLFVDNVSGATTNNWAIYSNTGRVHLGDTTEIAATVSDAGVQPAFQVAATNVTTGVGAVYGSFIRVLDTNASGSSVDVVGGWFQGFKSAGAGTITNLIGLDTGIRTAASTGLVMNAIALRVSGDVTLTAPTNSYGIYMLAINGGTTTNYAMYTEGGLFRLYDTKSSVAVTGTLTMLDVYTDWTSTVTPTSGARLVGAKINAADFYAGATITGDVIGLEVKGEKWGGGASATIGSILGADIRYRNQIAATLISTYGGVYVRGDMAAAGNAIDQFGIRVFQWGQSSSNASTSYHGIHIQPANAVTGTAKYGVKVDAITGGTTNNYGVYVDSVSGGSTNSYAIYTNTGFLRFGDNVGIRVAPGVSALMSATDVAAGAVTGGTLYAVRGQLNTLVSDTGPRYGVAGIVQIQQTTGTQTDVFGLYAVVSAQMASPAVVTNMYGVYSSRSQPITGTGTVTNSYGVYITDNVVSAGTLTNNYGLYIAAQTGGTNRYAIKTNAGLVQFSPGSFAGTSGTLSAFHVQGPTFTGSGIGQHNGGFFETSTSGTITSLNGVTSNVTSTGSGTTGGMYGFNAFMLASGVGGIITSLRGVNIERTQTNGTVTNSYGLYVNDHVYSASTPPTANYGIYILGQTGGSSNYAIYTNAGAIRFGDLIDVAYSTASTAFNNGVRVLADFATALAGNWGTGVSATANSNHTTGTTALMSGGMFEAQGVGSGGITTDLNGITAFAEAFAGHTITNLSGLHIFTGAIAGTITTKRQIRLDGINGGAVTSIGIDCGVALGITGTTSAYGIRIGTVVGSTGGVAMGIDIGNISGGAIRCNGVNIGTIVAAATAEAFGLRIGNISGANGGLGAYGILLGTVTAGASVNARGIEIGTVTGTSAANAGLYISNVTGGTTNNFGINVQSAATTGTNAYAFYSNGFTGATNNYGVYLVGTTQKTKFAGLIEAGGVGSPDIGTAGTYFGTIYGNAVRWKTTGTTFDSYDDLALIEGYSPIDQFNEKEKGGSVRTVQSGDVATLPWPMLAELDPNKGDYFLDIGDSVMFLLGAIKQLYQRHKGEVSSLKDSLAALTARVESMSV